MAEDSISIRLTAFKLKKNEIFMLIFDCSNSAVT